MIGKKDMTIMTMTVTSTTPSTMTITITITMIITMMTITNDDSNTCNFHCRILHDNCDVFLDQAAWYQQTPAEIVVSVILASVIIVCYQCHYSVSLSLSVLWSSVLR